MTELNEPLIGKAMQTNTNKLRVQINAAQKQRAVKDNSELKSKKSSFVVSRRKESSPIKESGGGFTQEANKVLPLLRCQPKIKLVSKNCSPLKEKVSDLMIKVPDLRQPLGQEYIKSRNGPAY